MEDQTKDTTGSAPISEDVQEKLVNHVTDVFSYYSSLLVNYRALWNQLFKATYVFQFDRKREGGSKLFFPKAFPEVENLAPKLTKATPKFVLNLNTPSNPDNPEANMEGFQASNQLYLNYAWKMTGCDKKYRTVAKSGIVAGIACAKTDFVQKTRKVKKQVTDPVTGTTTAYEEETVISEFPSFKPVNILDIYFDPRIDNVDEMPAVIENVDQVRIADLYANKELYFNLDKIKDQPHQLFAGDDGKKQARFNEQGIVYSPSDTSLEKDFLNYKIYYGYFSETGNPEDAKMVKATILNKSVVIGYQEIDFIPHEFFIPLEIPHQLPGVGVVEPITQLQDAYNLTRNQRFENISLILNRMWMIKRGSMINPKQLNSRAGGVIIVDDMANIQAVPTQDVTSSSFNEASSINTEIQQVNSSIDTTQDSGSNGFTNLATGQRIRYAEMSRRAGAIKTNLEEFLAKLGQKMLMDSAKKLTKNPQVYDQLTRQFFEIATDAFDSFGDFFTVSVLVNSTVNDSLENQRDEALAKGQLSIAYKNQGVNIDMTKVYSEIMETFPGTNPQSYILPTQPNPQNPGENVPATQIGQTEQTGAAPLSDNVVQQVKGQPDFQTQLDQNLSQL